MPRYIIRISRVVLEQVEETELDAPSLAAAKREASYILNDKFVDQTDVEADVKEVKLDEKKKDDIPF